MRLHEKNKKHSVPLRDPHQDMLAGIRELAPEIKARAAEIEAARRVPPDLVERLRSIGLFRMFVPRSHGGLELDFPAGLEVIKALARLDGSVGWIAVVAGASSLFVAASPPELYQRIYQDGPDTAICGSSQPGGTAERVADGYRVRGRWPFASGCTHADWIGGFCIVTENGKPVPGPQGKPQVRVAVLPARDWEIEDTWHAAGLKGTGSHHVTLRETLVSEAHFFDLDAAPRQSGPLYQAVRQWLPLVHGAFSVGMAEGTVDDLLALAATGRQQLYAAVPMRESEIFQYDLGRISANLGAAQAFHEVQAASHWRHALARTLNDEDLVIEGARSATWLATTCVGIADACFALAGASAVYDSSPLQRRLRDLHVAAQHAHAQQRQYVDVGKLALRRSAGHAG
ncbi:MULTISPECIES: flavin-dependent monooxygenase [Bradyrhizobium]|uniref:Flavin-dependent monooxygenase n=2 Tax=Bradyrhizobium TaxID=374 RepID=A0A1Y2JQ44_BRAJP|nr:flavin-dependent monooxygenase [Bradyrhizobium japonicum]OSJ31490.1 flavin-dependent monooxygenase [Bradyrhizobium japonicum]UFW84051.1 flavin-dependent monooxygenase [Bradyrhizobium japonicum]